MNVGPAEQVVEVRLDEEDRTITSVSEATLEYMYRYGLAHEYRLRNHRGNLGLDAREERDLFEAMRLATRLRRVDQNIDRTSRRNERLQLEIVRREVEAPAQSEGGGGFRSGPVREHSTERAGKGAVP